MLFKLLLIVFLFAAVFVLALGTVFLRVLGKLRPGREVPRQEKEPERVLACTVCGVHVPESEGIWAAGQFFCSQAHRVAGRGK